MAIQDRNLSVRTKLNARYKGETYHAEVVESEGKTLYRLDDGREFKSPSAAGTAITDKALQWLGVLDGRRWTHGEGG